ncbi:DUF1993 family protein [Pseudomonas xionganensis]|uniref:DUF1993 family protein n=1 Tax=Pseudomonas xionganensis TaxID=2654845 RepID=A0A6I4KTH0_9PSED|nr:DUF1993 family protein [Pseudomonas xionganensis]
MSLSLYQASIPVFLHMLDNLAAILDKAQQHAHDHKIDPQVLLNARLAPDMYSGVSASCWPKPALQIKKPHGKEQLPWGGKGLDKPTGGL